MYLGQSGASNNHELKWLLASAESRRHRHRQRRRWCRPLVVMRRSRYTNHTSHDHRNTSCSALPRRHRRHRRRRQQMRNVPRYHRFACCQMRSSSLTLIFLSQLKQQQGTSSNAHAPTTAGSQVCDIVLMGGVCVAITRSSVTHCRRRRLGRRQLAASNNSAHMTMHSTTSHSQVVSRDAACV